MRWKHYLIIALTIMLIAFFQPFIVFLGNAIVIGAALAYVYSDLTPEAQDAYEQKLADTLQTVKNSLRSRGVARTEAKLNKRGSFLRLLRWNKSTQNNNETVTEDAIEAEISLPTKSISADASNTPSSNDVSSQISSKKTA